MYHGFPTFWVVIPLKFLYVPVSRVHGFVGTLPSKVTISTPPAQRLTVAPSSLRRGQPRCIPPVHGAVYALRGEEEDSGNSADSALATLRSAVDAREVPAADVSAALASLAEGSGPPTTIRAEDVEGQWELVFSTQLERGYMPIRELVGFYPSREEATIDASAGPLPIGGMRGQCWWKGGPENELDFNTGRIKLGPLSIGKGRDEVKTYKFFVRHGEILGAKSSAGGFALLSRVKGD